MARDTIAAIATPPGKGGVAVVRVSGPEAYEIAQTLTGRTPEIGRIAFRKIMTGGGQVLDEGLVLAFAAPHSYTGEDVIEFQCHGGLITPRRILEACLGAGARLARRGEFTERAFLNGKMDLAEAESVLDLIEAKTDRAADKAVAGLEGRARKAGDELYARAVELSAKIEHALDVDEGELPEGFRAEIRSQVIALAEALERALRELRTGVLLREGALVVLAGPPNVGKSSLMNALLGTSRAIVSPTPGTTRDSIEAWLDLSGWPVRLVDTAGLRESSDAIESEGVKRARELIGQADIVLRLTSSDTCSEHVFSEVKNQLAVLTKSDLVPSPASGVIAVSSVTGAGLETLRQAIVRKLETRIEEQDADTSRLGNGSSLASERSRAFLLAARRSLLTGERGCEDLVLLANCVRQCAEQLGMMVGATYTEDMLTALFSRFCVGK